MAVMVELYCHAHHKSADALCAQCSELLHYAESRLDHCPFGAQKPTCAACPIHCYKPTQRERMRAVMRYAGPRMLWRHPVLALAHLLDQHRQPVPSGRQRGRPRRAADQTDQTG